MGRKIDLDVIWLWIWPEEHTDPDAEINHRPFLRPTCPRTSWKAGDGEPSLLLCGSPSPPVPPWGGRQSPLVLTDRDPSGPDPGLSLSHDHPSPTSFPRASLQLCCSILQMGKQSPACFQPAPGRNPALLPVPQKFLASDR